MACDSLTIPATSAPSECAFVTATGSWRATGGIILYQRSSSRGGETIVVAFVVVEKRLGSTGILAKAKKPKIALLR